MGIRFAVDLNGIEINTGSKPVAVDGEFVISRADHAFIEGHYLLSHHIGNFNHDIGRTVKIGVEAGQAGNRVRKILADLGIPCHLVLHTGWPEG